MNFKRRAYVETAATVPATEAFVTLNLVKSGGTDTKADALQFLNGGVLQVWNEATARDITVKLYYTMKETPGALTTGDWYEYDSVTVTADDGTTAGTNVILWSRPYKYVAVTASAASSTASSLELELYG